MRVVVAEYLQEPFLDRLGEIGDIVYDPDLYADRERLLEVVSDADAIFIRNRTLIDGELLAAAPRLRVIGRLGVGMDNIDTVACAGAKVTIVPALGANAVSVAEYVMGALLVLIRPVFDKTESMVRGEWPRQGHAFGHELLGRTLGLVGFGAIAREVATRASAFGMRVLAYDPFLSTDDPAWEGVERTELIALLARSDAVSIHVPLTADTRHLIDGGALASMKPGAVLVNTSRGGVVDEEALVEAMRRGRIAGAALDVFEAEPLGPVAAARFTGLDHLILTPHISGNTEESVDRVAGVVVDGVAALLGEVP